MVYFMSLFLDMSKILLTSSFLSSREDFCSFGIWVKCHISSVKSLNFTVSLIPGCWYNWT
jgi:hypothetical protein